MEIVHHALPDGISAGEAIPIRVDRLTLAKRRWRAIAEDGQEFGFDLEHPIEEGAAVYQTTAAVYRIAQQPEPVLEIFLGTNAAEAARLGWLIGNLHFQMEIAGASIRVADDPALRQLFEREAITFSVADRVFHPLGGGHHH